MDPMSKRTPRLMPPSRPRSTLNTPSAFRVEVRPPSLCHAPSSWRQRLVFWLLTPSPQDAAPPLERLPAVKHDFAACLDGIPPAEAKPLLRAIRDAHSLRGLWHLRADLYGCIGRAHGEHEAERRIERLNAHFSTRAPRAGVNPATLADARGRLPQPPWTLH
jgi:hypothetical protein